MMSGQTPFGGSAGDENQVFKDILQKKIKYINFFLDKQELKGNFYMSKLVRIQFWV